MYEVIDKIYVASILEKGTSNGPEIIQVGQQPLYERSSIFVTENRITPCLLTCKKKKTIWKPPRFDCMYKDAPGMYTCSDCGFKMYLKVNLKIHVDMVHRLGIPMLTENFISLSEKKYNMSNILKYHYCEYCEFTTHSLLILLRHNIKKHQLEKPESHNIQTLKSLPVKITDTKLETKKRFNCEQCTFTTKCQLSLGKHIQIKHHLSSDGQYECERCPFKSISQLEFDMHKSLHNKTEEMEFLKCNFCPFMTRTNRLLDSHVMYRHTPVEKVPRFNCNYCPYWTKQKGQLKRHIVVKHTSEENIKWFTCELCFFKTKTKSSLGSHMQSHSDAFFLCEICSAKCKRMRSLKMHMLRKHNIKM